MIAPATGFLFAQAAHLPIAHRYNGRGVAMASALGQAIGQHLLDKARRLPLRVPPLRPFPAIRAAPAIRHRGDRGWYRLRDALER